MDIFTPNKKLWTPNQRIIRSLAPHRAMMGAAGGVSGLAMTVPHLKAVDLNGTDEELKNTTNQTLGFANAFSIGAWGEINPAVGGSGRTLIDIRGSSNNNRIIFDGDDLNSPPGKMRLNLWDSAGTGFKAYSKTGLFSHSTKYYVLITWDGTSLKIYINGSEDTGFTKTTDSSGTMTDSTRSVYIGADYTSAGQWYGERSATEIWSVTLNSTNVTAIYNGAGGSGTGYKDDLRIDQGNYNQSANLVHQWKHGNDSTDANIGYDFVNSGGVNVSDNAVNVTSADVVTF